MEIHLAVTDAEIAACYPVMHELRPHLSPDDFLARVQRQNNAGYRLAYAQANDRPAAVAGFRLGENLAWGRFLYVDDLVTLSAHRSQGYGARLLDWLRDYALREGCDQLHLDSGMQRVDAHRFYEREGMLRAGYHFAQTLAQANLD